MTNPEIILINRSTWTGSDGKLYSRDEFELRGGDIAPMWATMVRVPRAPWCRVTIWNDEHMVSVFGGEVWPAAWPQLFTLVGPRGRQTTMLTPLAVELFAAARQAAHDLTEAA